MDEARIDDVLWRRARELAASPGGLVIDGLGVLRNGAFEARTAKPPTGYDAPALVVAAADELHVSTTEVRRRLAAAIDQAVASAQGRPAPLGPLGLLQIDGDRLTFHPARRRGAAPPDAIDRALAAWRAPADSIDLRVEALVDALGAIQGALSPADLRRLLDELDYDLDPADWQRVGARIVGAIPF
jgi:hypothetical protein